MTSTTTAPGATTENAAGAARPVPFGWVLLALATGGFAIGTTEFVSMGLLPEISRGLGVSIPSAGHAISAYALGVVVGAPLIAFLGSRWPRRAVLIGLMAMFVVGNLATSFVDSYGAMLAARFVSGLPHGAYFGVASLVAANLAPAGRAGRAVATVMLGLSFANVVGVPASTWLGQNIGWETAYWVVAALGLLTLTLVAVFVPRIPGDREAHWRTELGALRRPQVILTLLAGAVGFGGMFAVYTYIVPTVNEVGGLPESVAPFFLLAFGLGMVVGTWLAGRLADWSVLRSLLIGGAGQGVSLLLFSLLAPYGWATLPVVFAITALGSVMVVNLQLRLMTVSSDAPTMGAAMNHASLNVANALGAWLGGLVVAAGWGFRAPGVVGAGLSVLGVALIVASGLLERRTQAANA
ncbi:MAG: MFS transporter [Nocardioides sp.]|uniref:MFS transporter n=1 Tax=Nocardioides sp. TaxID=35761 RepID=UPI003F04B3B6